jgi:hypothetical protein
MLVAVRRGLGDVGYTEGRNVWSMSGSTLEDFDKNG